MFVFFMTFTVTTWCEAEFAAPQAAKVVLLHVGHDSEGTGRWWVCQDLKNNHEIQLKLQTSNPPAEKDVQFTIHQNLELRIFK